MPFTGKKIGFALFPQRESVDYLNDFLVTLRNKFQNAEILLSFFSEDHLRLIPLTDRHYYAKEKQDLVARAYILLEIVRTLELDYLFFNIGMTRYDIEATVHFVTLCQDLHHPDIIYGEPPIVDPFKEVYSSENLEALKIDQVRQRLLVDTLINIIISKDINHGQALTPDSRYSNVNAGLFCAKTSKDLLRFFGNVEHYENSSLVCSQMVWHLMQQNGRRFSVKPVPVKNIQLVDLGFSLEKAVKEINFVFHMVASKYSGSGANLSSAVDLLFHGKTRYNRWMRPADKDWFYEVVVPRLRNLGCVI